MFIRLGCCCVGILESTGTMPLMLCVGTMVDVGAKPPSVPPCDIPCDKP